MRFWNERQGKDYKDEIMLLAPGIFHGYASQLRPAAFLSLPFPAFGALCPGGGTPQWPATG
jgi:hypothetical protein